MILCTSEYKSSAPSRSATAATAVSETSIAPITARSASRSCGGTRAASAPVSTLRILPRRSITYKHAAKRPPLQDESLYLLVQNLPVPAVEVKAYRRGGFQTRPYLQFGDHDHLDARFDVAVDLYGHLVGAKGLYGLFEADSAPVEADTAGSFDRVGDIGRRDRTEQALVLAGPGFDRNHALVEDAGDLLGPLGQTPVPLLRLLHRAAGFLQLARGRHLGEAAWYEEVAHVAAAHIDDVATLPDLLDVLVQYYLHVSYLPTT